MKILLFLTFILSLYASAMTIDEEILTVQQSSPENRYKLMNALKKRISSMNISERKQAIMKLRKDSTAKNGVGIVNHIKQRPKILIDQMKQNGRFQHQNDKKLSPFGIGKNHHKSNRPMHNR